jgi:hypothetical protein
MRKSFGRALIGSGLVRESRQRRQQKGSIRFDFRDLSGTTATQPKKDLNQMFTRDQWADPVSSGLADRRKAKEALINWIFS